MREKLGVCKNVARKYIYALTYVGIQLKFFFQLAKRFVIVVLIDLCKQEYFRSI